MPQLLESDSKDLLGHPDEAVVPLDIAGRQTAHLGPHALGVTRIAEHLAVVEADQVKRVDGTQVDVVGERAPAYLPQLLEQERRGDHRRPRVERETVLAEHTGSAAGLVMALHDVHVVSACHEPNSRGQAAEACSDDNGTGTAVVHLVSGMRAGLV